MSGGDGCYCITPTSDGRRINHGSDGMRSRVGRPGRHRSYRAVRVPARRQRVARAGFLTMRTVEVALFAAAVAAAVDPMGALDAAAEIRSAKARL